MLATVNLSSIVKGHVFLKGDYIRNYVHYMIRETPMSTLLQGPVVRLLLTIAHGAIVNPKP